MKKENSKKYVRTDLATECTLSCENPSDDYDFNETDRGGFQVSTLVIKNENGARITGKSCGKYVSINCGKIWLEDDNTLSSLCTLLSECISQMTEELVRQKEKTELCILVAGLGNAYITPDALGPKAVKGILVTRHIKALAPDIYTSISHCDVAAISPGVLGQTGIETLEIIRGAVNYVKPSLLIVIDALAAKSTDRLATTIQLNDNGISPGSGIGNKRAEISYKTVGVPVLVIGVPTVVDSSTLVYSALENAGISEINPKLKEVLENGKSFFVSLKESDTIIEEIANVISKSINLAFGLPG